MGKLSDPLSAKFGIPCNPHLHVGGPKLSAANFLALKSVAALALERGLAEAVESDAMANLRRVSEADVATIDGLFGEEGLFRLNLLAMSHIGSEFAHFYDFIRSDLMLRQMRSASTELPLDRNLAIGASSDLEAFSHNVINVSLSRKLYNPGTRDGYLVYGIGGPRILVSLPFRDKTRIGYDVFNNSIDVVTSLWTRGYHGTFLALDSLKGLDVEMFGRPAWLLWFSVIACHSDLVIFVRESGQALSPSQEAEVAFTPDRVRKVLVELNAGELRWAKSDDVGPDVPVRHILPDKGVVSEAEWQATEFERIAGPFVRAYERGAFPNDRLIVVHEEGGLTEYPPHEVYGHIPSPLRRLLF